MHLLADYLRNTAGDIALSFNNEEIYTIIRDAGIRAGASSVSQVNSPVYACAELVLALLSSRNTSDSASAMILRSTDNTAAASTDTFLSSKLRFTVDEHGQDICMLDDVDGDEIGVMMGWEKNIMQETVANLTAERDPTPLKVLNVGFGLGLVRSLSTSRAKATHPRADRHTFPISLTRSACDHRGPS